MAYQIFEFYKVKPTIECQNLQRIQSLLVNIMSQSIKQKIQAQIYLNEELLNYDDSDSEDLQLAQQNLKFTHKQQKQSIVQRNIADEGRITHEGKISHIGRITHEGRIRPALKELIHPEKSYVQRHYMNQNRPLKVVNQQNIDNSKTIIQLKSKLAQVLKESQQKQTKIQLITKKITNITQDNEVLTSSVTEKDCFIKSQNQNIQKQKLYEHKMKTQHEARIISIEQQSSEQIHILNQIIQEAKKNHAHEQQALINLQKLLALKNQEILQLKATQKTFRKCFKENQRLKDDLKRLLNIRQRSKCLDKSLICDSSLQKDKFNEKYASKIGKNLQNNAKKSYKTRSKSLVSEQRSLNYTKSKTMRDFSQLIDSHYLTLPQKDNQTLQTWFPTILINEVQCFLKKWRLGYNNKRFVNSLVEFINTYTEKSVKKNKYRMENQYKSLKKQIQRKANQSLSFQQIINVQRIRDKNLQGKMKQVQAYQSQIYAKFTNQSQNVSVLVPASNNEVHSRKNRYQSIGPLNHKTQNKQDTVYHNLERSIQLHHKNSCHKLERSLKRQNKLSRKQQIINFHKQKRWQSESRKTRTEFSADSPSKNVKKQRNKSKDPKIPNSNKLINFSLKKYKII